MGSLQVGNVLGFFKEARGLTYESEESEVLAMFSLELSCYV